ncbi:uncharacterized protein LOC131655319 [Vicia villosa]|uniref:uncharacterized protein LOC131655319 n=1 Tax=Vicia villosa TaxID=3911 RepID=UPI00273CC463|nr:uncharacterized protein LOC131655319 [Vicia villosa]
MAPVRRLRDPKRKSDTDPNLLTMQLETRKTEPGRNFFGEKLLCSCGETESIPKNIYTRSQLEASVANKEGFFVKRMAENDSRPEGLPQSHGGKYVGFGSSPAPSFQRSNSQNYYFSVVSQAGTKEITSKHIDAKYMLLHAYFTMQNSKSKKRKMNSMVSGTLSSFNDIKPEIQLASKRSKLCSVLTGKLDLFFALIQCLSDGLKLPLQYHRKLCTRNERLLQQRVLH